MIKRDRTRIVIILVVGSYFRCLFCREKKKISTLITSRRRRAQPETPRSDRTQRDRQRNYYSGRTLVISGLRDRRRNICVVFIFCFRVIELLTVFFFSFIFFFFFKCNGLRERNHTLIYYVSSDDVIIKNDDFWSF